MFKKIEAYDKVLNNLSMIRSVSEHIMDSSNTETAGLMAFFFSASHEAIIELKALTPEDKKEFIKRVKEKSLKENG